MLGSDQVTEQNRTGSKHFEISTHITLEGVDQQYLKNTGHLTENKHRPEVTQEGKCFSLLKGIDTDTNQTRQK